MNWRVGVDIGGTFTDVAMLEESKGRLHIAKVSTTPRDFAEGVLQGLSSALRDAGVVATDVRLVAHATTVVTNALLEHKGARTALVCTEGFRDVLELRRSARADLYDLNQDPPAVLVPRHRRLEVRERIDAQGDVVIELDDRSIDALVDAVGALDVEAIAVSLLFSFLNPRHEARIAERLRAAFPDTPVFVSSEVLPEIREFERTSTTAVCAYVGPILTSYLRRLEEAIHALDLPQLHVMGSSGGIFDVGAGLAMPAMAVESGPAAGVIAAERIGRQLERSKILSFDMGGTTAKASLIEDGRIVTTSEYEVGGDGNVSRWLHGTGHPIRVPVIDLAEVSAGGGSVAWLDPAGSLRVGPRSAGAEPGPVCYGRGGSEPTVTDCNLVLGRLDGATPLAGGLTLDRAGAEAAIRQRLADPLNLSVEQAAASVIRIVNAGMAEALRIVSVERGHDPRDFSLVAFGGAGPMHAAALAEELDIPEIIVPPIAGGFSALGLVACDLKREYARTFYTRIDEASCDALAAAYAELGESAKTNARTSGFAADGWRFERSADVRYARQAYELNVPVPDGTITSTSLSAMTEQFHALHRTTYGHDNPDEPVQIVNIRLVARGDLGGIRIVDDMRPASIDPPSRPAAREMWIEGEGFRQVDVRERAHLGQDKTHPGPMVIESVDATLVVPPQWEVTVDQDGCLHLTRESA
ncbi:MAG: hydantoinase/oxoprolinase family protein [Pseudomonadota bacterium]